MGKVQYTYNRSKEFKNITGILSIQIFQKKKENKKVGQFKTISTRVKKRVIGVQRTKESKNPFQLTMKC